jgi:hypothetical protein
MSLRTSKYKSKSKVKVSALANYGLERGTLKISEVRINSLTLSLREKGRAPGS